MSPLQYIEIEDFEEELDREEEDEEERRWKDQFRREQNFRFSRVVSGTRLHFRADVKEIPEATVQHLRAYVQQAHQLGVVAAIAVNSHVEQVKQIAAEVQPDLTLHVLHVPCWGAFVPALNALLNFAQSKGAKWILYQSLEVCCSRDVLQRVMDHHDSDTLVVGPVLDGHKSSPWNTLALWSVRKLALTGFLCIADGLPDVPPSMNAEAGPNSNQTINQGLHARTVCRCRCLGLDYSLLLTRELCSSKGFSLLILFKSSGQEMLQTMDLPDSVGATMGSDSWWNGQDFSSTGFLRQATQKHAVPAGVEEVTAIALLQHLHGSDRARAILLQLPDHLQEQLSWAANWGKDEARRKWHKYKMASKVARPAAQLQELFKFHKTPSTNSVAKKDEDFAGEASDCFALLRRRRRPGAAVDFAEAR
eukprot:g23679.t1